MGYVPQEYLLFRAARYMGVAPWELEVRSVRWLNSALAFESIEAKAETVIRERRQKASKRKTP
jgi:hypothetical protein